VPAKTAPAEKPAETLGDILGSQSSESGIPSRRASTEETGAAPINSSAEAPPSTQPTPGFQDSILPEPSVNSTMRETPPSILEGPAITRFSDFVVDVPSPELISRGLLSADYRFFRAESASFSRYFALRAKSRSAYLAAFGFIIRAITSARQFIEHDRGGQGLEARREGGLPLQMVANDVGPILPSRRSLARFRCGGLPRGRSSALAHGRPRNWGWRRSGNPDGSVTSWT
jgi:hypothetical protein